MQKNFALKTTPALILAAIGIVASGTLAHAGYVGITVGDPHANKTFTPPPGAGSAGPGNPGLPENNETEWNAVANQSWDLESFEFDSATKKLKMTGGFNFITGVGYNGNGAVNLSSSFATLPMGDIFVYVDTGVPYLVNDPDGQHSGPWTGSGDWDYVIAFRRTWDAGTIVNTSTQNILLNGDGKVEYKVVAKPSSGSSLITGGTSTLNTGLPWRFGTQGQTDVQNNSALISAVNLVTGDNTFSVADYSSSGAINAGNKDSWLNSIAGLNLGNIDLGDGAYFHTTMRCGNDVLWGRVPDAGATMTLLGVGLLGLGWARRLRN